MLAPRALGGLGALLALRRPPLRASLQEHQPGGEGADHRLEVVGAEVDDLVEQEIGLPLAQSGPVRRGQALSKLVGPTLAARCVGARRPGPIAGEGPVRLRHGDDRVEERRAGAERRHMVTSHAHRQSPTFGPAALVFHEAQLFHGGEVIAAHMVELGRALLDGVLHAQGVQAVLDREAEERGQVEIGHMSPTDVRGLVRRRGPAPVPEAELAEPPLVDVPGVAEPRVVVDDCQRHAHGGRHLSPQSRAAFVARAVRRAHTYEHLRQFQSRHD
mmetsp:Transcript_52839/g.160575  ORF Transcript_52839/g.160575 Transcript_52839/m.160575 type:complete len:273 (-) Transcript_52839:704-1522(-)